MTWFSRPPLRSPFAAPEASPTPRTDDSDGTPGGIRILTVCTGNICRSAWAQHVLQARLDQRLGTGGAAVTSAGTGPNQALSVPLELLDLAGGDAALRGALEAHRPRLLTARVLEGQDLVLTATEAHRDAVAREAPAALRRSATFLRAGALFAELQAVAPGGGPGALADALARGQASRSRLRDRAADLPDPFRGPAAGYAAMLAALNPALDAVVEAVERALTRR